MLNKNYKKFVNEITRTDTYRGLDKRRTKIGSNFYRNNYVGIDLDASVTIGNHVLLAARYYSGL